MANSDATVRYNLTLPNDLDADLEATAKRLGISKAEAIRRSITLIKHASQADKVELTKGEERQTVLLR
jgi:hypothetical protein